MGLSPARCPSWGHHFHKMCGLTVLPACECLSSFSWLVILKAGIFLEPGLGEIWILHPISIQLWMECPQVLHCFSYHIGWFFLLSVRWLMTNVQERMKETSLCVPGMEEYQITKRFGGILGPRKLSYLLFDEKCLWGVVHGLGLRLTSTWNVPDGEEGGVSECQDFFTLPRMEIGRTFKCTQSWWGISGRELSYPNGFRSQGYFVLGKSLSRQHIRLDLHVSLDFQECGWRQVHPFKAYSLALCVVAGGLCFRNAERVGEYDITWEGQKEIRGQEVLPSES